MCNNLGSVGLGVQALGEVAEEARARATSIGRLMQSCRLLLRYGTMPAYLKALNWLSGFGPFPAASVKQTDFPRQGMLFD